MRILITGVGGFVGRAMWRWLCLHQPQAKVFGLDVKLAVKDPRIFACDILDQEALRTKLRRIRPDCIFHLAGAIRGDDERIFVSNFLATKSLLGVLPDGDKRKGPRVVVPGSAAEYGRIPGLQKFVTENTVPRPLSWYGFVKHLQTNLAIMAAQRGLDVVVARIFNIVGYGTPESLALGKFASEIVKLERTRAAGVLHTGFLDGRRDFIDIEDVCAALWALAQKGKTGEVYQACSGQPHTIRELVRQLLKVSLRKDIRLREAKRTISQSFDVIGSNRKIRKDTGWRPRTALADSLRSTLQFYREQP